MSARGWQSQSKPSSWNVLHSHCGWFLFLWFYMCLGVLPMLRLCTVCVQYLRGPEGGGGSPDTGVADSCEPPCGCWESSLDILEEQVVLSVEPALQPLVYIFTVYVCLS